MANAPSAPTGPPGEVQKVKMCTFNVTSAGGNRLVTVLREMQRMEVDLVLLTETKLPHERYTRYAFGYQVCASKAVSHHQGGVAFAWKEGPHWHLESQRPHGPNVISGIVVSGRRRWLLIGAYLPLDARRRAPDLPLIVMGDLNIDLDALPRSEYESAVISTVAELGLQDVSSCFKPARRFHHGKTWQQRREGVWIRSRCDYILSDADRTRWRCLGVRTPRGFYSDHVLIMGLFDVGTIQEHRGYVAGRRAFPLKPGGRELDRLFTQLGRQRKVVPPRGRPSTAWVSQETWQLVDQRAEGRRSGRLEGDSLRHHNIVVRRSFQRDRRRRTAVAGEAINTQLEAGDLQGAWSTLKSWYRHSSGRPPKPLRADLNEITAEYTNLGIQPPPTTESIPVMVDPFPVSDATPDEEEIAEHWIDFINLVQTMFETGEIPDAMAFSILVLIPKPEQAGKFRGIGLLEPAWKVISMIINQRLAEAIQFHPAVHGFRNSRGTGTAILECKLLMQIAHKRCQPLYQIFLDFSKAYPTLHRERSLEILKGYGVGRKVITLLRNFWEKEVLVARQGPFYGEPFSLQRGCTQGDPLSPTIFNIVEDAVLRFWSHRLQHADAGRSVSAQDVSALYYADDGQVAGFDRDLVQAGFLDMCTLFRRMGLELNPGKTQSMVCGPRPYWTHISSPAYKRRLSGQGDSHRTRKRRKVSCPECGKLVAERRLSLHRSKAACACPGLTSSTLPLLSAVN